MAREMAKCLDTARFSAVEESRRPIISYGQEIKGDMLSIGMRGRIVNWLVTASYAIELLDDTVHLAVSYFDRFLSKRAISQDRLQLLCVTALFVASKYVEIDHPKAATFSAMTKYTYSKQQVVKMEADILICLNFEMGTPTVITFVRMFLTSCCEDNRSLNAKKLKSMCIYLAELSLLGDCSIKFRPSVVAAACLFVAKFTINPKIRPWSLAVQRNTGYKVSDIKGCIVDIHNLQSGRKFAVTAIRDKYRVDKFQRVSTIIPKKIKESFLRNIKYANG
ncbi:putative cyclin-F3-2 isoform X2 [Oryza brachyantha]|uniref:Uncharacterized protein n=1 Tax=Oryza brachyantha TaxID=4533 RepID=J3LL90_ORYBR|nr:putative cyclin-F3-2 isoform X2 [Oryza brachyantha]